MSQEHAHTAGETAGLPGANAAPETSELNEDEAVTVSAGDALPEQSGESNDDLGSREDAGEGI